jgi:divalent metal cation (Fe/Co/Zn/Cd) transporter
MRLHEAVVAIMAVFIVVPGLVFLRLVIDSVRSGHMNEAAPIALAVVLFMLAMMLGGFALESRRALRDLALILEASRSELT